MTGGLLCAGARGDCHGPTRGDSLMANGTGYVCSAEIFLIFLLCFVFFFRAFLLGVEIAGGLRFFFFFYGFGWQKTPHVACGTAYCITWPSCVLAL